MNNQLQFTQTLAGKLTGDGGYVHLTKDELRYIKLLMKSVGKVDEELVEGFDFLNGKEFWFYGVDGYRFKLARPGFLQRVYEAIEDESDGYRSYLKTVMVVEDTSDIFFKLPLGLVRLEPDFQTDCDGWLLRDVHRDHIWLRFGTNRYDSYYPTFYFTFTPYGPESA